MKSFAALTRTALWCVSALLSGSAIAQSSGGTPLRVIVPYAAGGQTDVMARVIGEFMQKTLQRPVIVENRPGAGGLIGLKTLQTSPADGNTLLFRDSGFVAAPLLLKAADYDPLKDLQPVASVGRSDMFFMVSKDVPAKTIPEFIAWAKTQPNGVTAANNGQNTGAHLAAALFGKRTAINVIHVPYKGVVETVTALITGDAKMQINVMTDALAGQISKGNVRLLAAASTAPSAFAPGLPRVSETVANFGFDGFFAFLALPAVPTERVDAIAKAVELALTDATTLDKLQKLSVYPVYRGPRELGSDIARQYRFYKGIVDELGVEAQ